MPVAIAPRAEPCHALPDPLRRIVQPEDVRAEDEPPRDVRAGADARTVDAQREAIQRRMRRRGRRIRSSSGGGVDLSLLSLW